MSVGGEGLQRESFRWAEINEICGFRLLSLFICERRLMVRSTSVLAFKSRVRFVNYIALGTKLYLASGFIFVTCDGMTVM